MLKHKWLLLALLMMSVAAAHGQGQTETINWTDATRDVYVAGQVDRSIQVFYSETAKRMALIWPSLDRVIELDLDANMVGTVPKSAWRVAADRTTATSDASAAADIIGPMTVVDETTYSFDFNGKGIIIMRHKGLVGDVSEAGIWADVPIWRTLMNKYQPDAQAVTALKKNKPDAAIIIAAGTWCGDSKHYVPQLLRALHEADNRHLHVRLVGIANKFVAPADFVKQRDIKKVPTIIVERDGHEIGRIIETPVTKTMEEDLAAILAGHPNQRKDQ
ncbi:MAG TPA: thioredoxin family protein [Blastocatellia bacterium]|nr:thioredoxin family protein [Blastocatellia bacterium]